MNYSNDLKFQVPTNSGAQVAASAGVSPTTTDGGQAAALALMQLEQLLEGLDNVNGSPAAEKTKEKAQSTKEELLQDIVELLKAGLSKGLKKNPEQVRNMVALTAGALSQYTATDPKATGFVVSEISIAINDFLLKNPKDQDKVVFAFSPLISLCGASVTAKLAQMNAATVKFQAAFAKEDPVTAKPQLESLMNKLVGNGSGRTFASILNSIKSELNSLDLSDAQKYISLVRSLYGILSLVTISNPSAAQKTSQILLSGGFISAVYALEKPQMESLLQSVTTVMKEMTNPNSINLNNAMNVLQNECMNVTHYGRNAHEILPASGGGCGVDIVGNINGFLNSYQSHQNQNTPNLSTILGAAMLCFQEFEQSVSQSQANQDQATIAIGQASVQSAIDLQTNLDAQITKEAAEIAKANSHPWWDYLIEAVVALIAVIVSAVTAGVGAAIAAALVAGFMASPLGSEVQMAIATKIAGGSEQDLYNKYVKEGMSPQAAQEKASEEWNKAMGFAGLIMVVATIIVTAGVGGIGGAAEGAGDAAAEGASQLAEGAGDVAEGVGNVASEASTEAAEQSSTLSRLASYSVRQGLKVGLTQGLSMMATLDPMLNFLLSNPLIANNQTLVRDLSITLEVVVTGLAVAAGYSAAQTSPQALSQLFSSLVTPLIVTNGIIGAASAGYSMYTGIQQADYLKETADLEESIGGLNQASTIYQGVIKMNEQTQTNINTADTSIINGIGSDMTAIENMGSQLVPVGG